MEPQHPSQESKNNQEHLGQMQNEDVVRQSNEAQPNRDLPQTQPSVNKSIPQEEASRKRKRMRLRQLEAREAKNFMKQPVMKISNLNKNLKRAYEKGFFDDSKFDFIRSLRKIRKHPEQDSVSSHYRSDDQSFDINDVLPKRGFQKKRIIENGLLSSSDSEAVKEKKISKPRKPREPKQNPKPRKPRQPRQSRQPKEKRQLRQKKQANSQKQLKKQPKPAQLRMEQQKKDIPKKSGVQIRYTKAPAQMPKKIQKKQDSQDSLNQSESQFKSSDASRSQEEIIAQKIRESEVPKSQQKSQMRNNESRKGQPGKMANKNIQDGDKLRISVQQAQKLLKQPQKIQIVNLNSQLPAPLVSNKFLPPNISSRKEQQAQKTQMKRLQESKNESSDSQSSESSSSQSSSSSESSSSDQQVQSKLHKEKKKKKRESQSSSSQDSQRDKKKKKKNGKKHKRKQNQSESILTKLIKDDKLRKMLVKQKEKEAEKKLQTLEKKEKNSDESKKQTQNEPINKNQKLNAKVQSPVIQNSSNMPISNQKKYNLQSLKQIQKQVVSLENKKSAIHSEKPLRLEQKLITQPPSSVQNRKERKTQVQINNPVPKQINHETKVNQKSQKFSTFKTQPINTIQRNEPIIKPITQNSKQISNKMDVYKPKEEKDKKQAPKIEQVRPAQTSKNLKQKSKKLKNLSMENNVVAMKVSIGKNQDSQNKDKKAEPQEIHKESKNLKPDKKNRIREGQQIKIKHHTKIKQTQTQESEDSSEARYYHHKRKYKHIPKKVVRYRKIIVQRSQSSDSGSSEEYVKKRVIRRVKRGYSDSESSDSEEEAVDFRALNVESRKGQKIRQVVKKKR